ncbi:unnamed protein product [Durusdinium trenchii]|uniref:Uncharacterized protein n=1 Tax=Durusdinium trenchii TaxID=1381693 RepID=A0ABP0IMA1_9DINO
MLLLAGRGVLGARPRDPERRVRSGPVGSGKSTLVLGLLRELTTSGLVQCGGRKALCGQEPWIMSASVYENICAVDVHVATALIQEALLGALKSSTRVVVANTFLPLLLPHAQQVVILDSQGGIEAQGPLEVVHRESPWLQEVTSAAPAVTASVTVKDPSTKEASGALLIAEDRNVGVLSFHAYASYFQHATSSGSLALGALLFLTVFGLALLAEGFRTFTEVWVTLWTSSVSSQEADIDVGFWVLGYGCIVVAVLVIGLIRAMVFSRIVTQIGGGTFHYMVQKVLNASAPLFFDVVPVGRILNRFSKDLDAMDTMLPECMSELLTSFSYILSSMVMCTMVSTYALAGLIPLCMIFIYIRRYYVASFRELQRLESVSRSSLYVHFSEVSTGLVHLRSQLCTEHPAVLWLVPAVQKRVSFQCRSSAMKTPMAPNFEEFLDASLGILRNHLLQAARRPGATSSSSQSTFEYDLQRLHGAPLTASLEVQQVASVLDSMPSPYGQVESDPSDTVPVIPDIEERSKKTSVVSEKSVEMDTPGIAHGDSSAILNSNLSEMNEAEKSAIRHRLRARLGQVSSNKLVSGKSLHEAICALGLTRYSEENVNDLLNHLASFIDLRFDEPEDTWSGSIASFSILGMKTPISTLGPPVWEWPSDVAGIPHGASSRSIYQSYHSERAPTVTKNLNVVPLGALMELFLAKEGDVQKKIFGKQLVKQFKAMKEILLAGDTNRLVAELTCVRINDLAEAPEPIPMLAYLEPFVAVVIFVNGVMMGFQTDPHYDTWPGWAYFELGFAIVLILEVCLRLLLVGCREFLRGADRWWNSLDCFLSIGAWVDVIIQFAWRDSPDVIGTFLVRYLRLVRMARIVKIFRLTFMKDLRLMMRGLIAGVWTLALAFILLFTVIYVIAGTATITLDRQVLLRIGIESYFYNIPTTMFTAFRCFTGDCVDELGHSLTSKLSQEFGVIFVLGYIASYMLVTMGIFNVILAVYVEITMRSAKESDEQYSLESIKVARATRELLKKFAAAHHVFHVMEDHAVELSQLEISQSATLFTDDEIQENIEISKELFLLVIHDRGVQALMDDLELPSNRAHLFEVIDADGSGTLHIQELVQGLLKLRGEVNKGDCVAPLLATKSVQEMVCSLRTDQHTNFERIHRELLLNSYKPAPLYEPKRAESESESLPLPVVLTAPDSTANSTASSTANTVENPSGVISRLAKLQLPVTRKPEIDMPPEPSPVFD